MPASLVAVGTNCVVNWAISPAGAAAEIRRRWRVGEIALAVPEAIIAEYEQALGHGRVRRRHGGHAAGLHDLVAEFGEFTIVVEPAETPPIVAEDLD